MEIRRILFPTDFSENSEYALMYALAFARQFDATLTVLHVVHVPPQMPELNIGAILDRMVKHAERNLSKLIREAGETRVAMHPEVRLGVDYREITAFAEKEKMDLIVMGTHGRTGMAHALLGSVAERVVRHAPCPVLTVKRPPARRATAKRKA
jgi:nucleotide-binding universal stress UspA family protein